MQSLVNDVGTLQKKGRVTGKRNAANIALMLAHVRQCRAAASVANDAAGVASSMAALQKAVKDGKHVKKAKAEHKSLHIALAKVGKSMDKVLNCDSAKYTKRLDVRERAKLMSAVCEHLYRHGDFEVATSLQQHPGAVIAPVATAPFERIVPILAAFRKGDYGPAMRWAADNSQGLQKVGSSLAFELHKLRFVQILASRESQPSAIAYGQRHFPRYAGSRMADIQRLMGAVLYAGRLAASPYAELAGEDEVARVEQMLVEDNCLLQGLPPRSALGLGLRAGFVALPQLLKLQAVLSSTSGLLASTQSLPVEIDIPEDMHFHSEFACPVTRELVGEGNPPMLLKCGHVVSKEALDNIVANRSRFKCPTCRVDQNSSHVQQLHL